MSHSNSDNWIRRFDVSDPQRHANGFTVYKITSVIFPKNCPEAATKVVVWKRFKNFLKLHSDLKQRHEDLHLKVPFPPFPKAKFFGRFEEEVVEQRRQAALVFLQFVADIPVLFTSQPFVKFFESGYTLSSNNQSFLNNADLSKSPQRSSPLTPDSSDSATTPESRSTSPIGGNLILDKHNVIDYISEEQSANTMPALLTPVHTASLQDSISTESGDVHLLLSSTPQSEQSCEGEVQRIEVQGESVIRADLPEQTLNKQSQNAQSDCIDYQTAVPETTDSETANCTKNERESHVANSESVEVYITDAAYHLGLAAEHEASDDMEAAFAAYKAGIACLLSGVKDDPDEERVKLVKSKTAHYLLKAEKIYQQHLSDSSKHSAHSQGTGRCLLLPLTDLKYYKVLGVATSVILTRNTQDNHTYVIKVLHKSSCPIDGRVRSVLPANVPFMCRLYACFENESSVFLVLQHANGGLLWDHVHAYLNSPDNGPDSPPYIDQVVFSKRSTSPSAEMETLSIVPEIQKCHSNIEPPKVEKPPEENYDTKPSLKIPDVVLSETKPVQPESSKEPELPLKTDNFLKPDSCHAIQSAHDVDVDTVHLLEKAQELLESVNKSLTNIEGVSSHAGAVLETQLQIQKERRRPRRLAALSPAGRSQDRSRRSSAVRRSRWEKKFSCDDMFEGRARALSGSLDREAQWLRMAASTPTPRIPTTTVRSWAAQLLLALEAIHRWGIIIGDLHPENLLLTSSAVLMLTYQCSWVAVDRIPSQEAIEQLYAAPEVSSIGPVTVASDWWSFGVLLFELLSGESLAARHPAGFFSHSVLDIPSNVPPDAADLLTKLVRHVPSERLGAEPGGVQSIKEHEFFKLIDWRNILLLSATV